MTKENKTHREKLHENIIKRGIEKRLIIQQAKKEEREKIIDLINNSTFHWIIKNQIIKKIKKNT